MRSKVLAGITLESLIIEGLPPTPAPHTFEGLKNFGYL